jgi:hypothetical protein
MKGLFICEILPNSGLEINCTNITLIVVLIFLILIHLIIKKRLDVKNEM